MIIAKPKPVAELVEFTEKFDKILLVGCGGCASVCAAGGEKEAAELAVALRHWRQKQGSALAVSTAIITRQCDAQYLDSIAKQVTRVDAVISLACGVGVQFLAECYAGKPVLPGLNTVLAGGAVQAGLWEERCGLCGNCMLHQTGGICPVSRCAKSIQNGPCGGSQHGKCEINPQMPCAWHLIYEKLLATNRLDLMMQYRSPKDWSKEHSVGAKPVRKKVLP